jgi:seipin
VPQSTILAPVHIATSRPAIKAYLSTILFLVFAFILFSLSTAAYLFFYYSYIPQIDLSRVIYLQYGAGLYPHATVSLDTTALISQQPYDIFIELHIPRTPGNLAAGNFMLDLFLLTEPAGSGPSKLSHIGPNGSSSLPYTTIASSRRPAILPYSSPLVSIASTIVSLPWHMLSLRDPDAHRLSIPMFEQLSFARGSAGNIPSAIRLELQSDYILQIYSSKIVFHAEVEGLRYLIYNYRTLSFLVFTGVFYSVTLSSMGIAWLLISTIFPTSKRVTVKKEPSENQIKIKTDPDEAAEQAQLSNGHIKTEPTDKGKGKSNQSALLESDSESDHGLSLSNISDTATTFPGIGRQMPLRMPVRKSSQSSTTTAGPGRSSHISLRGSVSEETVLADTLIEPLPAQVQVKMEDVADDEQEETDRGRSRDGDGQGVGRELDSGVGTSLESENAVAAAGLTRRR